MEAITASCPQCNAQYQLTQEQLSVANGQVRCGNCMTVFQAVPPEAPAAPIQEELSSGFEEETFGDEDHRSAFVNDDDDLLIEDTGVRESLDSGSEFETGEFSSAFSGLDEEMSSVMDDFSDSDELSSEFSDTDDSLFSDEMDSYSSSSPAEKDELVTDESWAEQLMEEEGDGEDADDDVDPLEERLRGPAEEAPPKKAMGTSGSDFDFDDDLGDLDVDLSLSADEQEDLGFGESNEKEQMRGRIPADSLELNIVGKDPLWLKISLGAGAFLAVIAFVGQLLYFQFDTLARDSDWRDTYSSLCGVFGCELPSQYRIEDISANHLTVKTHPHYDNALMVDAIITNHAEISQPFPRFELIFSDLKQNVIAARQFLPDEYLRGELADAELMPSRHPIHITFEINDPGQIATGYVVQLTYPEE